MLIWDVNSAYKYNLMMRYKQNSIAKLQNVRTQDNFHVFDWNGKPLWLPSPVMVGVADAMLPSYKGLLATSNGNKQTLASIRSRVAQLEQQCSNLNVQNSNLVLQNDRTITQMRSANQLTANQIQALASTLQTEKNSALLLKAKAEQSHIENAATIKMIEELRKQFEDKGQQLNEKSGKLAKTKLAVQQSEDAAIEKEKKMACQQAKIRELEAKLITISEKNEEELKLTEATLEKKALFCKQERDRLKALSEQAQQTILRLREAIASYDTYPSSECTTDQEEVI